MKLYIILGMLSMLLLVGCSEESFKANIEVTGTPFPQGNAAEQFVVENSLVCDSSFTSEDQKAMLDLFCADKGYNTEMGWECILESKLTVNCG